MKYRNEIFLVISAGARSCCPPSEDPSAVGSLGAALPGHMEILGTSSAADRGPLIQQERGRDLDLILSLSVFLVSTGFSGMVTVLHVQI